MALTFTDASPEERSAEFRKVVTWQLERRHDTERIQMVMNRTKTALALGVITQEDYEWATEQVRAEEDRIEEGRAAS